MERAERVEELVDKFVAYYERNGWSGPGFEADRAAIHAGILDIEAIGGSVSFDEEGDPVVHMSVVNQ